MISDPIALQELQQSWDGVRGLLGKVRSTLNATLFEGSYYVIGIADVAYNLPFLHACSVLNEVLLQLRDEGHFKCGRITLGDLIHASQHLLPWNDFAFIKAIVDKRNDVAHRSIIVPRDDSVKYIEAIERELLSWKIINPV